MVFAEASIFRQQEILVSLCWFHTSDALDLSCPELTREEAEIWKVQES
jgi:hypothetical protein